MNETQSRQVEMHKNFFDRCQLACDHGFYMEAILMEYAAVESRLEILLGVVGLPCNKYLDDTMRIKINISQRTTCLEHAVKNNPAFQSSKLNKAFFKKLWDWIKERNRYIHGLYKNELLYKQRMKDAKKVAENGYDLCKVLYNEAHRLRRACKKNPELLEYPVACESQCAFVKANNKGEM